MPDDALISSVPSAPWLPDGSTAEAWAGHDCVVPDPCIIVRLLLVRETADAPEFFCVPSDRGLDLPTRFLGSGETRMSVTEGLASLASQTYARIDMKHRCVGYIRNVVPSPDSTYPHPTPWAHVPVFVPAETVEPTCEGTWLTLDSARPELSARHWWPIVEAYLGRTQLTPELERAIALGYERRDRADMAPTVAYFEELLAQHPDHPVLIYEVAGAYDTAGDEATACGLYERALALGLRGEPLRRCLCQYGSTLRWLGRLEDSLAVLDRAAEVFPGSESVRVFRALTLNDAGRTDEAVGELLAIVAEHGEVTDLGRYAAGLTGLAQWLREGRPEG